MDKRFVRLARVAAAGAALALMPLPTEAQQSPPQGLYGEVIPDSEFEQKRKELNTKIGLPDENMLVANLVGIRRIQGVNTSAGIANLKVLARLFPTYAGATPEGFAEANGYALQGIESKDVLSALQGAVPSGLTPSIALQLPGLWRQAFPRAQSVDAQIVRAGAEVLAYLTKNESDMVVLAKDLGRLLFEPGFQRYVAESLSGNVRAPHSSITIYIDVHEQLNKKAQNRDPYVSREDFSSNTDNILWKFTEYAHGLDLHKPPPSLEDLRTYMTAKRALQPVLDTSGIYRRMFYSYRQNREAQVLELKLLKTAHAGVMSADDIRAYGAENLIELIESQHLSSHGISFLRIYNTIFGDHSELWSVEPRLATLIQKMYPHDPSLDSHLGRIVIFIRQLERVGMLDNFISRAGGLDEQKKLLTLLAPREAVRPGAGLPPYTMFTAFMRVTKNDESIRMYIRTYVETFMKDAFTKEHVEEAQAFLGSL